MITDLEFKTCVENCGGIVKPWNQDDWIDERTYMHHGACLQFAAVWIRNQKFREIRRHLPSAKEQFDEVSWMCEQKSKGRDVLPEFLLANGLKKDSGQIHFNHKLDIDKVAFFVLSQEAYYLVGAKNDDDGHSIAFNTRTVNPRLFDPNYGEAKFATRQGFEKFLKLFWRRSYDDLDNDGMVFRFR